LDTGFYLKEALLGGRQVAVARKEISGESLGVPTLEHSARAEGLSEEVVCAGRLRGAMGRRRPVSYALRSGVVPEVGIAMLHL